MSTTRGQIFGGGGKDSDDDCHNIPGSQTGQVQIDAQGTDSLLDEIDGLLEDNAEEFVNSYVQKGGE